MFASIEEMNYR